MASPHLETEEMAFQVLICTRDGTELQRKTDGLAAQRSPFADQTRLFQGMWVQRSLNVEPLLDSPHICVGVFHQQNFCSHTWNIPKKKKIISKTLGCIKFNLFYLSCLQFCWFGVFSLEVSSSWA